VLEAALFAGERGFVGADDLEPGEGFRRGMMMWGETYIFSVSETLNTSSSRSCCNSCAALGRMAGFFNKEHVSAVRLQPPRALSRRTFRFNMALMTAESAWLYPFGRGGTRALLSPTRVRKGKERKEKGGRYRMKTLSSA
jgi:hypothetical protein